MRGFKMLRGWFAIARRSGCLANATWALAKSSTWQESTTASGSLTLTVDDQLGVCRFAANKKNPDILSEAGVLAGLLSQASLVAGTGFEPVTFRL